MVEYQKFIQIWMQERKGTVNDRNKLFAAGAEAWSNNKEKLREMSPAEVRRSL